MSKESKPLAGSCYKIQCFLSLHTGSNPGGVVIFPLCTLRCGGSFKPREDSSSNCCSVKNDHWRHCEMGAGTMMGIR